MSVKLPTEHHLEFLRFNGGCTSSSESTLVKIPHCWKSHVAAHLYKNNYAEQFKVDNSMTFTKYETCANGVSLVD